jgi:hypothetical protein
VSGTTAALTKANLILNSDHKPTLGWSRVTGRAFGLLKSRRTILDSEVFPGATEHGCRGLPIEGCCQPDSRRSTLSCVGAPPDLRLD